MLYQRLVEERLSEAGAILCDGTRSLTYAQLHEEAMRILSGFQAQGLQKGDRVLVTDAEPMTTALVLLACTAGGFVCAPVSRRLDKESRSEIRSILRPALTIDEPPDESATVLQTERPILPKDTLVYILCTSGTEGTPKGVTASQKQIFFCCDAISRRLSLNQTDRILCSLPMSFDYGMYQIFLSLWNRATLYLDSGSVLQKIPYLLKRQEITIFPTIPTVANILVRRGLLERGTFTFPCLRTLTFTGEILPVSIVRKLAALFTPEHIVPMYGLTECKRVSIMPPDHEDMVLAGSCGLPLDGVSVRLEDVNSKTGIGRLVVEGDNVMEGYWGAIGEEGTVFFRNPETGRLCVRTSDLFRINREGFLFFQGRISDLLKIRGHRVSGAWLETRIGMQCQAEIAVVGIPDFLRGERAAVFVYAERNVERETAAIRKALWKLPDFLRDMSVIVWESPLPKNCNGKIDRATMRRIAEEML